MRDKKLITIIVVLALIVLDVLCVSLNMRKTSNINSFHDVNDVIRNNSKLEEKEEIPKEEEKDSSLEKKEEEKKEKKEEEKQEKEKAVEETPKKESNTRTVETQKPSTPTYHCPDGYTLNGTTCTSVVSANYVCPLGLAEAVGGCVNLSAGSTIEEGESCPDGSTMIDIISLGEPTIHQCFTLHSKIYTCNDGYSLDGTNCVRRIDATRN